MTPTLTISVKADAALEYELCLGPKVDDSVAKSVRK